MTTEAYCHLKGSNSQHYNGFNFISMPDNGCFMHALTEMAYFEHHDIGALNDLLH